MAPGMVISLSQLIDLFGPDSDISSTIGWICTTFKPDIQSYFGDPLTFPLVSPAG